MAQVAEHLAPPVRVVSFGAATLIVAALVGFLALVSVRFLESDRAPAVTVVVEKKQAVERRRALPTVTNSFNGQATESAPSVMSEDAVAAARVLDCLQRQEEHERDLPPDCPHVERLKLPELWERPLGQPRRRFTADEMYSRSWQRTMIIPCTAGYNDVPVRCRQFGGFGMTPPPPAKTPEQYCLEARMGGPCKPPPQERVIAEVTP